MTREKLIELADGVLRMASARIFGRRPERRCMRLVVVVTDVDGEWCAVSSNTNPVDTQRILKAALYGADRQNAEQAKVIDAQGEEA